jgi:hypothetical protein
MKEMCDIPRRTIAELQARYDYEPSIRDIYVEGHFDVDVLSWFLDVIKARDVKVYPIETVDVPADLPDGIASEGGDRTRVVRLANAFERSVGTGRILCIVDADCDIIAAFIERDWKRRELKHLMYTDVASMEMYLYSHIAIAKLLHLYARNHDENVSAILRDIGNVLKDIFAIRYTNTVGNFRMSLPQMKRCCTCGPGYVAFDMDEFITRTLSKNSAQGLSEEFRSRVAFVRSKLPEDPRQAANGHDYLELIEAVLRARNIVDVRSSALFERVAVTCIDLQELMQYAFWRDIGRLFGLT